MSTLRTDTKPPRRAEDATAHPTAAPVRAGLRRREGLQALAAVIAAHAALLAGLQGDGSAQRSPDAASPAFRPAALDIRSVAAAAKPGAAPTAQASATAAVATTAAAALPPRPATLPPPARPSTRAAEPPRMPAEAPQGTATKAAGLDAAPTATASLPDPGHGVSTAADPQPAAVALAAAVAVADRAAQGPSEAAPVYATAVAGDFRWTYTLQRGLLSGTAELGLRTEGGRYELDLRGTALGLEILGMSSRGGFDAAGFAPERFVDRRRGRDRLAANFDRSQRRITYSGSAGEQPLAPGTQDRLSWMLQLSAIVQAAPQRFGPGSRIVLPVSGARADLDLWSFSVQARQAVDTPAGRIEQTLMLVREPRRPYDTQVEIWLDPARQHLPVRARLTVLPGGETLELVWAGR